MKVQVENIKPAIGSIVRFERSALLDDDVAQRCLELLEERQVLVFPRINLTDKEQLAFTDKLGARVNFTNRVPGGDSAAKDVYTITLDPKINNEPEYVLGTYFWHMDGITVDMPPPKASVLSARKVAPKGGQTEFASTFAAYQALPEEDKAELEGLRVLHSVTAAVREVATSRVARSVSPRAQARASPRLEAQVRPQVHDHRLHRRLCGQLAARRRQSAARASPRVDGPARLHLPPLLAGRRPRRLGQLRRVAPGHPLLGGFGAHHAPDIGRGRRSRRLSASNLRAPLSARTGWSGATLAKRELLLRRLGPQLRLGGVAKIGASDFPAPRGPAGIAPVPTTRVVPEQFLARL